MTDNPADTNTPLDPSGPPQAPKGITLDDLAPMLVAGAGVATAALSIGFVLVSAGSARTSGATRTAHLQWEQRTVAIEQAVAEQDAERRAAGR